MEKSIERCPHPKSAEQFDSRRDHDPQRYFLPECSMEQENRPRLEEQRRIRPLINERENRNPLEEHMRSDATQKKINQPLNLEAKPDRPVIARCDRCDLSFYRRRAYRDHLVESHWKPPPADVSNLTIEDEDEDEGDDDDDDDEEEVVENEHKLPRKPNWFRALYRRNIDELEAEGYHSDNSLSFSGEDSDKDSYWDCLLPPGFIHYQLTGGHDEIDWRKAERARIKEHNDKYRKETGKLGKQYDWMFADGLDEEMMWEPIDDDWNERGKGEITEAKVGDNVGRFMDPPLSLLKKLGNYSGTLSTKKE